MNILTLPHEVRDCLAGIRRKGRTVGFVPTMGCLHQGHLSLVHAAARECSCVIVSVFVNPTQFGPREDYRRYPRNLPGDLRVLQGQGVHSVFAPGVEAMYPAGFCTSVVVERLSEKLEGKARPGHFRGVCTVVLKLLNIVQPDRAYFGWKDAQQLVIVRRMVADLDLPVRIVGLPIVRDADGLAMSSRNVYLTKSQRRAALCLPRSLELMRRMAESERVPRAGKILRQGRRVIRQQEGVRPEYLAAVDLSTLDPVDVIGPGTMIAGAIRIGGVRLIDNTIFPEPAS